MSAQSDLERVLNAAARALERAQVACDTSGAADEAAAILEEVVRLDGSLVPASASVVSESASASASARRYRQTAPTTQELRELQRELGVCPWCGRNETVVCVRADIYVCATPLNHEAVPADLHGHRRGHSAGCGATWRGARLEQGPETGTGMPAA